ncbi:MAG TPA: GYD domain-containing protein [Thermoguttaceae bacterium]|nr:GYD domain-containing protein [Thermoguttaceae bacterium]
MATYVMLGKYSLEAMDGITAERTDQAVALLAKYGGKLEMGYALMGENDLLLVADFPDVQHAIQASVTLAKATGIAFNTSPTVSIAEFDKLVERIL